VSEQPSTAPVKVKSQSALRENGYVVPTGPGTSSWWGFDDQREETPELRWPQSVQVYDRMRRQDSQVASVLRAVTHPVRRTTWRLDPNGARAEVVAHIAQDLGLRIIGEDKPPAGRTRDRFSWASHLQLALLMLPLGAIPFEQVYRLDETTGLLHLRKLGPRMPDSIDKWNVARDGGLISIVQRSGSAADQGGITIPVNRLVVYVHEREGGEWWGTSLLRTAYKHWLLKDRLLRTQTQTIDRNGMGIPVYKGQPGATPTDLDEGAEIAQNVRAGDNSGIALPNGADMELMGVTGTVTDPLPAIKYHDEQIARAVLAHFLNLGQQTGSWALGSTFADFFTQSLQAVAEYVADVATQHIVEDLVDVNYGPDEPAPRVTFDEIGSQTAALAQAIKMLVDSGVLTADEGLEAFVRVGLGLPSKSGDRNDTPPTGAPQ
jgi:hypothetical protein